MSTPRRRMPQKICLSAACLHKSYMTTYGGFLLFSHGRKEGTKKKKGEGEGEKSLTNIKEIK